MAILQKNKKCSAMDKENYSNTKIQTIFENGQIYNNL